MQKEKRQGSFLQLPAFFLDTCNLPEAQQLIFMRLFKETWGGDNEWIGSIRKLAKVTRSSIGSAFTAKKILEDARLISIRTLPNEKHNADSIAITINNAVLWDINAYYCAGNFIPNWKKLTDIPGVQILNRGVQFLVQQCSENEQGCSSYDTGGVQILNSTQAQECSNFEQGVFNSQAQSTPLYITYVDNIDSNTVDTIIDSDANASLNDEPQKENKKVARSRNAKPAKAPISLPDLQGPKTPDTLLQLADYCRGRHCMSSKQKKARVAAESLSEQKFTLEQFRLVWAYCSADDRMRNELGKPYLRDEGFINGGYPLDIWILEDKMLQKLQAIEKLEAAHARTQKRATQTNQDAPPAPQMTEEERERKQAEIEEMRRRIREKSNKPPALTKTA